MLGGDWVWQPHPEQAQAAIFRFWNQAGAQ